MAAFVKGAISASVATVLAVSMVAQFVNPAPVTPSISTATQNASQGTAATPIGPVAAQQGPGPTQVDLRFVPFTPIAQVEHWAEPYALTLASYYPAFGSYVFDLPKIRVDQMTSNTALVTFPPLSQTSDVNTFLSDNHLSVIKWLRTPSDEVARWRVAVVLLPQVNLHRIDPAKGTWAALLPAHLDIEKVRTWAQSSGLELINYDPATGEVGVYAAGTEVLPPPPTAALLAQLQSQLNAALANIKPTPTTTPGPGVPGALQVTSSSGGTSLSWSAAQGASGYAV